MDSNNLMQALYAMDRELIKTELNIGADVNAPYNKHGWTPFMWACREFYEPEAIKAFHRRHWRFCSRPERISTRRINSAIPRLFMS